MGNDTCMTLNEVKEKNSKTFKILYKELQLEFELFTIDYIFSELKKIRNSFESIYKITVPEKNIGRYLQDIYLDRNRKKYHFFCYIKFFEYEGQEYGIVGGKTNYLRPDISFDYLNKKDNRIARTFLKNENLKWSRNIIILNHAPNLEEHYDEKQ